MKTIALLLSVTALLSSAQHEEPKTASRQQSNDWLMSGGESTLLDNKIEQNYKDVLESCSPDLSFLDSEEHMPRLGDSCSKSEEDAFEMALEEFSACTGIRLQALMDSWPNVGNELVGNIDATSGADLNSLMKSIKEHFMNDLLTSRNPYGDLFRTVYLYPDKTLPCFANLGKQVPECFYERIWPLIPGTWLKRVSCIIGSATTLVDSICEAQMDNLGNCLIESLHDICPSHTEKEIAEFVKTVDSHEEQQIHKRVAEWCQEQPPREYRNKKKRPMKNHGDENNGRGQRGLTSSIHDHDLAYCDRLQATCAADMELVLLNAPSLPDACLRVAQEHDLMDVIHHYVAIRDQCSSVWENTRWEFSLDVNDTRGTDESKAAVPGILRAFFAGVVVCIFFVFYYYSKGKKQSSGETDNSYEIVQGSDD